MSKWSVASDKNPKSEPSVVKWVPAHNDFPTRTTSLGAAARLDENDKTKIRFHKAGYYLLLGRVATRLKKNYNCQEYERMGSVQLELRTNGGLPLHTIPDVVSYPRLSQLELDETPYSYNKKMVEYGPMNDIMYAESDSYISVRATGGACFARHGTAPGPTAEKIPAQSLSAVRLDNNIMRVDRYQVSFQDDTEVSYIRALGLGGEENMVLNQAPLFAIVDRPEPGKLLRALEDCRCIVVGCLSYVVMGSIISLYKNNDAIVHSQLCSGNRHGHGSHSLNAVVEIKANDTLSIKIDYYKGRDELFCDGGVGGHLAFLVLHK